MPRKLRVERELPFFKVGSILNTEKDGRLCIKPYAVFDCFEIEALISTGWFSWVDEPETLEQKFAKLCCGCANDPCYKSPPCNGCLRRAEIARKHYREEISNVVGVYEPSEESMLRKVIRLFK